MNLFVVVILGVALLVDCTARNPAWMGAFNPVAGAGGHAAGNGGASGNIGTAGAKSGTDAAAGDSGVKDLVHRGAEGHRPAMETTLRASAGHRVTTPL